MIEGERRRRKARKSSGPCGIRFALVLQAMPFDIMAHNTARRRRTAKAQADFAQKLAAYRLNTTRVACFGLN